MITANFPAESGATFSDCGRYRYRLWRRWALGDAVAFVMLNPSTADAATNDPTVERCERRAQAWGYGSLIVANLFGWRSTDPGVLRSVADPVGPQNIEAIVQAVRDSAITVLAWGTHGHICGMGPSIMLRMRQFYPEKARVLKMNRDGSPAHPLYLPYSLQPVPLP